MKSKDKALEELAAEALGVSAAEAKKRLNELKKLGIFSEEEMRQDLMGKLEKKKAKEARAKKAMSGASPAEPPKPDGEYTEVVGGLTWGFVVERGELTITSCCPVEGSVEGTLEIPAVLGGHPVTRIGASVFDGTENDGKCSQFSSVTIPDTVTRIGAYAFCSCESLMSLTIPDSVEIIENEAFGSCQNLTALTLGNSVRIICDGAFWNCGKLESVTIPPSLEGVGEAAFGKCESLDAETLEWLNENCPQSLEE